MAGLSPAAMEVLQRVKDGMHAAQGVSLREKCEEIECRVDRELLSLSVEDIAAVGEQRANLDGKEYAEWAAHQMVEMLRENDINAGNELWRADLFWQRKLQRGYLVQPKWLSHAWKIALELAKKPR